MWKSSSTVDNGKVEELNDLLIKSKLFAMLGALLPGIACYACIVYTYVFQFERIRNFTVPTCPHMHSFLPPVSYIIGVWEPTRTLWLFVMFMHFPARLFYPFLYNCLYGMGNSKHINSWWYTILQYCCMRAMILEAFALVSITVFDVVTRFYIHATAFGLWLISLNFTMSASILLHYFSGVSKISTKLNRIFYIKMVLCVTGITLSLSTAYTYPYSTTKCSRFIYLMFSVAEYLLVGINSLFYFLIYWDCSKIRIGLTAHGSDALRAVVADRHNKKTKNLLFCINSRRKCSVNVNNLQYCNLPRTGFARNV